jgi:hypothetical protein
MRTAQSSVAQRIARVRKGERGGVREEAKPVLPNRPAFCATRHTFLHCRSGIENVVRIVVQKILDQDKAD